MTDPGDRPDIDLPDAERVRPTLRHMGDAVADMLRADGMASHLGGWPSLRVIVTPKGGAQPYALIVSIEPVTDRGEGDDA